VLLAGAMVAALENRARAWNWSALQRSGYYGDPPSAKVWLEQSFSWTCIVAASKLAVLLPQLWYAPALAPAARALVQPWIDHPKRELVFVMVVVPLLTNVVTIVVYDAILKAPPPDELDGADSQGAAAAPKRFTLRSWSPARPWFGGGAAVGKETAPSSVWVPTSVPAERSPLVDDDSGGGGAGRFAARLSRGASASLGRLASVTTSLASSASRAAAVSLGSRVAPSSNGDDEGEEGAERAR